jgi:hypothetical protein
MVGCLARAALAALAVSTAPAVFATPGIKVLSQTATDGPIKYTVKMASKNFGNQQETRTIRSGQTDDFTWQTAASGQSQPVPDACPNATGIPRNANGVPIRQVQIRFASVVADDGAANVQISFQGHAPRGSSPVTVAGKKLQCPVDNAFSQVVRFSMPTGGGAKNVTLGDGTQLTVSADRK